MAIQASIDYTLGEIALWSIEEGNFENFYPLTDFLENIKLTVDSKFLDITIHEFTDIILKSNLEGSQAEFTPLEFSIICALNFYGGNPNKGNNIQDLLEILKMFQLHPQYSYIKKVTLRGFLNKLNEIEKSIEIVNDNFVIDGKKIVINGKLPRKVLNYFLINKGRLITPEELITLWPIKKRRMTALRGLMTRLKKTISDQLGRELIEAVQGRGYIIKS